MLVYSLVYTLKSHLYCTLSTALASRAAAAPGGGLRRLWHMLLAGLPPLEALQLGGEVCLVGVEVSLVPDVWRELHQRLDLLVSVASRPDAVSFRGVEVEDARDTGLFSTA